MRTLQDYMIAEGLLDMLTGGIGVDKFCKTIQDSVNKGVKIEYDSPLDSGKKLTSTSPLRVSLMFDEKILNWSGFKSFEDYAKQIATTKINDEEKFDKEEYEQMLKFLRDEYKKITADSENVKGAICIDVTYAIKKDEKTTTDIYAYVHPLYGASSDAWAEEIKKGKISKDFVRSIYWTIFCAICKPSDEYSTDNEKTFKDNCDETLKQNIIKLAGNGAPKKLEEWKNKNKK